MLCLLSGQRCQATASLDLNFTYHSNEKFTFATPKVMKTAKPGTNQQPIEYYLHQENEKICVVDYLPEYTRQTELIR